MASGKTAIEKLDRVLREYMPGPRDQSWLLWIDAWGEALSRDGAWLYTANGGTNDVSVIDVKQRKELARIKVGDGPWGIAIVPKL